MYQSELICIHLSAYADKLKAVPQLQLPTPFSLSLTSIMQISAGYTSSPERLLKLHQMISDGFQDSDSHAMLALLCSCTEARQ